ncbi:MAG: hypothetical protein JNL83_27955 [Myxococcales bacterium]|nr:hypothetical protein [Myxococcales bacterium]
MKRIGEILVESGFATAAAVERALVKQKELPRRLCSLLIARDVIDVDIASRALAEQYGVPAALQKHLDRRDRDLAALIPAELARSWCVLPLGRTGKGDLIVCARDPSPAALAAVSKLVRGSVVLAVAPASLLETLVAETYGLPEEDFDVDLTTGPIHSLELDPVRGRAASDGGFGNLQLVELDDKAVSRDPAASGSIQIGPSRQIPLPPSSAGMALPPLEDGQILPRAITPPARIVDTAPPVAPAPEPPAVAPEAPPVIARTVTPPIIVIPPKRPSKPSSKLAPITSEHAAPQAAAPDPMPIPTEPAPPPPAAPAPKFKKVDTDVGALPNPRAPAVPRSGVITRRPPTMPPPATATVDAPLPKIMPAVPPRAAKRTTTPPRGAPQSVAPPLSRAAKRTTTPPRGAPMSSATARPGRPSTPPPPAAPPARPHPVARPPSVPPLELAPPEFDAQAIAVGTQPPRRKAITVPPTTIATALDATLAATSIEELVTGAIRFAAGRWRAVLMLEVRDRIAAGEAGHGQLLGDDVIVGLALPLAVPSMVSQAVERGTLATEPPESIVQERLDRLLGMPRFPAAMPVMVDGRPRFVLAVGDAIAGDTDTAMQDLEKIAIAVGAAFTKLSR